MKKKNIVILSVIVGIATFSISGFIIYTQLKGIKKNSEELIAAKKDLIMFQGQTEGFERFKKTYQELEPDLKKMDNLFVDPEVPIDLIKFWENTASDSGLLVTISPAIIKAAGTDPWESMGFQIVLTGSFPKFLKFLEKIEAGPYLAEVQSLVIRKQEKGVGSDVRATLLTKVFTK